MFSGFGGIKLEINNTKIFSLGCPVGLHACACVLGSREMLELPGWKETPEARSLPGPSCSCGWNSDPITHKLQ